MTRRSERKKAAKAAKAAPPPDFVHAAAGRVGPLVHGAADRMDPMAHSAASRVGPVALGAADLLATAAALAHAAAERMGPLAESAADRVGPLTHAAADRVSPLALSAADLVGPYAHRAGSRVSPYAQATIGRLSPYAQLATHKVGPFATGAKRRSARLAQEALEKIGPRLDDALDAGRHKVSDDLIPKLAGAFSVAAGSPIVAEATRRGQATLAAAKGELVLPPPKKKRRWLLRFAILAALAGVAAVAARKFLGSADADWQAARPSAPYTPPQPAKAPEPETAPSVDDTAPTTMDSAVSVDTAADVADLTPTGEPGEPPATESDMPASDAPASETEADASVVYSTESDSLRDGGQPMDGQSNDASVMETELPIAPSAQTLSTPTSAGERPRYEGEGIYIGLEPPEGYTIKGNERSKKYHVPESAGYARTTAEVWFNSEEAAERAGFIRAQR